MNKTAIAAIILSLISIGISTSILIRDFIPTNQGTLQQSNRDSALLPLKVELIREVQRIEGNVTVIMQDFNRSIEYQNETCQLYRDSGRLECWSTLYFKTGDKIKFYLFTSDWLIVHNFTVPAPHYKLGNIEAYWLVALDVSFYQNDISYIN